MAVVLVKGSNELVAFGAGADDPGSREVAMVAGSGASRVVDSRGSIRARIAGPPAVGGQSLGDPRGCAWGCAVCGTGWALRTVNPRLFLDRLAAAVALNTARSVLRGVISLADQVSGLTDEQLRHRLIVLAELAARGPGEREP